MKSIRVYGLTCVLMLVAGAARATTIVLPSDEQLVAKSPVIVEGTVLATETFERDGRIWTDTTIAVERRVKGRTAETITIREIGGETAQKITKIFGAPEYETGERVLVFLEPSPHGGYRTMDLFAGKFAEAKTMNGRRLWHRAEDHQDVTLLDANLKPLQARNVQREAAGFEEFLEDRVAGRAGKKNYGIENPVLEGEIRETHGRRSITANFELIEPATIYRWFGFERGQTANWYSSGTQSGYSGGGVNELRTAMAAWTSYSGARILYNYAGSRSGSLGGLDNRNGVNEVLFDDPLSEIAGSYDKTTGGVVGIGGFNGIVGPENWTAPFDADAKHTAGVKTAWDIVEGNLTVQDGVTAANGIPGNMLAEIISHEFGHTLGFGHSEVNTALMYYSITGGGPSLKPDDQLAARWLYPSGSTPPPPPPDAPAAPTNAAVASQTADSVTLRWTDNSNNETGFAVYVNNSHVGNVAANTTQTTVSGLTAGTYSAYVVAVNGSGSSAASNTVNFTITGAPVASFTVSPSAGMATLTQFAVTNQSTGPIESYAWSFGDNTSSTAATPAPHIYAAPGEYTIRLTVTGAGKTAFTERKVVVSGALTASFNYEPQNPVVNDHVTFTDTSAGAPSAWQWDFGDGTTSTLQNPGKTYTVAGAYTVKLTVYRDSHARETQRTINVLSSVPVTPGVNAAFTFSPSNPAVGADVTFTDGSSGNPTSWSWSFGDGATSTSRNPVHAYTAPGTYHVSLTASNASTSGTTTKLITVGSVVPYRTLLSVAAQTGGVGGTSWRTELNVFNAGTNGANVTFIFLPSAGGSVATRNVFVSPNQSLTYANALLDLFGMSSGAGALAIEATSAGTLATLRVSSRTFTTGTIGTYGQNVPSVAPDALTRTLFVTGIAASGSYRTNIGLVNRSSFDVATLLTLYNRTGSAVATANVTLAPNSFQQSSLGSLFPSVDGASFDVLTMRIESSEASAISAYASVVDNATQDPIYIQAVPAPSGNSLTIPVVGRSPGNNGTFWRSDLTLFNTTTLPLTVTLAYNGATTSVVLGGGDTRVVSDVLQSEFGLTSGSGLLQVLWSGNAGPVVTSRTYTSVQSGGTYGQAIDPVASSGRNVFVPGLRNDASYRTNVGLVNNGSEPEQVTVRILAPTGNELARTTLTLAAKSQSQYGAAALFPNAQLAAGFTLHVEGDANANVFAYGSMVDNASGDPVFFAGQ